MAINYEAIDLNQVVEGMAGYAKNEFNFLGAAVLKLVVIVDRQKGELRIKPAEYTTRFSRSPEPEKRGADDTGTDYLAMADGKAAKRLRKELGIDIIEPETRRGEPEVAGDDATWLTDFQLLVTAFSGAPKPDQDEVIAEWGITKFRELAAAQVWNAWDVHERNRPKE